MDNHQKYKLENQFNELEILLDGINDELYFKKINEKWSIHENMAHLGRYQEIFLERIKRIMDEYNPNFARYKAEHDDLFFPWTKKSRHQIIHETKEKRKEIIGVFKNIKNEQYRRKGSHPKFGNMDLSEWLNFFLLHESHHIFTIFRLIRVMKNGI